jgi:hypothetical protein
LITLPLFFLDDFRCFVLEFLMLTVQDFHGWFKWWVAQISQSVVRWTK